VAPTRLVVAHFCPLLWTLARAASDSLDSESPPGGLPLPASVRRREDHDGRGLAARACRRPGESHLGGSDRLHGPPAAARQGPAWGARAGDAPGGAPASLSRLLGPSDRDARPPTAPRAVAGSPRHGTVASGRVPVTAPPPTATDLRKEPPGRGSAWPRRAAALLVAPGDPTTSTTRTSGSIRPAALRLLGTRGATELQLKVESPESPGKAILMRREKVRSGRACSLSVGNTVFAALPTAGAGEARSAVVRITYRMLLG
jgi:hypothetical protein